MPFPESDRVIYKINTLGKVICQLRFPPILKIDAEIPYEFQDRIRDAFPNYSEKREIRIEFPSDAKVKIPPDVLNQLAHSTGSNNYEFSSENGEWVINLTRTFISLSANNYRRWEEFVGKLVTPLDALVDIYSPSHYSRVGLRYINIISRSALGLDDVDWNELLSPWILGVLGSKDIGSHVGDFESKYEINLSDNKSIVRLITQFVESIDSGELGYKIDSDFFNSSKTTIDDAMETLNYFNSRGSRLIRWCITDRLHEAMEPEAL